MKPHRIPTKPGLLLAMLLAPHPAGAATTEEKTLYLGPVHYQRSGPWLATGSTGIYPTGDYEGDRLLIRGDTLGVRLWQDGDMIVNAVVVNDLLAFRARSAGTAALRALNDRKDSFNGGLEAVWRPTGADELRADVLADVANRQHAVIASLAASHTFSIERSFTQVIPRLALAHFGGGYANYYFGIAAGESLRSGLPEYHPGSTRRLDAGLTVAQPLSHDLVVFADIAGKRFDRAVSGSPLLARTRYSETSIGILYNVKSLP